MNDKLLNMLKDNLESFLTIWTRLMDEAGYLAHTTAKRQDCIDSFSGILHSVEMLAPENMAPLFGAMLKDAKNSEKFMLQIARNHRLRGITDEMFLGCFKTLIHALEEILVQLAAPADLKLQAELRIRKVCDVLETIFVSDWEKTVTHDLMEQLQGANRQLTLKKNRYENIFRCTSDLVVLTDSTGLITEVNPESEKYINKSQLIGHPFWIVLDLAGNNLESILDRYSIEEVHEVVSKNGQYVFNLNIVPLQRVSLASQGFMLILTDITILVNHRQDLERHVAERTAELQHSQYLLSQEKSQIEEMNVTLRHVMTTIESDRLEREKTISRKIRTTILPALEKIKAEGSYDVRSNFVDLVREQLISLTAGFGSELDSDMLKLSRTEIRICQFIQAGCSTKEISEAMNLAFDTIRTHRKNIRKKLALQGTDTNLYTFLSNRNCNAKDKV